MLSFETSTWMPPMGDKKKRKDTDLNFVPFQMTKYSMIQCQREHLTVNTTIHLEPLHSYI